MLSFKSVKIVLKLLKNYSRLQAALARDNICSRVLTHGKHSNNKCYMNWWMAEWINSQ